MPPALPPPASTRPWWSRSKSSKDSLRTSRSVSSSSLAHEEDEKYHSTPSHSSPSRGKDALKFNTLASAIGLKSRKLPALTIQDPPSPILPAHPYLQPKSRPGSGASSANSPISSPAAVDRTPFYTNRPPAKSVSTVRSSEYDYDAASELQSEPRTPSDHPRDRSSYQHSVMTFSEMDPFASGGIVVQHLPQDPNRLSVYSDSSVLDPQHKLPDAVPHNRRSYGSSSSNSTSHGNFFSDGQALSPLSATSASFTRSPPASRSAYDLSHTHDPSFSEPPSASDSQAQRTRRTKTPSGSNSSNSTVTPHDFRSRLSEPPPGATSQLPRKRSSPALVRPRGLTVGVIEHMRPGTSSMTATMSSIQPLQIRRKASGSSSPSSSNTPSPSPVTFSLSRTASATSSIADTPVSPPTKRPTVLIRKASSPRLPPLPAGPPASNLPLPPVPSYSSPYDSSPLEFRASSSSSSLNFAPSVDMHDFDTGDAISQLMNDSYDYGPFDVRDSGKGKRASHRYTYVLDGDLSPVVAKDVELNSGSPLNSLSKFPPVPTTIGGELPHKPGKLLKKIASQQNLVQVQVQRVAAASGTPVVAEDVLGHGNGHSLSQSGKTPRKQRSFHASRVPLPPLPSLWNGSSSNGHPSPAVDAHPSSPTLEPRRSSVTSPRKRLFSGSSARRSTSSHASPAVEDDKRSVFSFDSDIRPATAQGLESITMSFASGNVNLMTRNACIAPTWEEPADSNHSSSNSNKRVSQSEYIPQYIMAPSEQLKLAEDLADAEARAAAASAHEPEPEPESERVPKLDLQPGDFGMTFSVSPSAVRSRSNSVLSHQSTHTLAFGPDKGGNVSRGASIISNKSTSSSSRHPPSLSSPTTPVRKLSMADNVRGPSRSSSMLAKALNKPPALNMRPATAQASLTPPHSPVIPKDSHPHPHPQSHSPVLPSASLPPPPRRRPSRHDLLEVEMAAGAKRTSVVPINPLSPPPSVRGVRPRRQESTDTVVSRPPSSFDRQKILKRRSLMKKPSFLDIEDENELGGHGSDEDEEEEEEGGYGVVEEDSPGMESSFLDMDRGRSSFDTIRSMDSAAFCV